MSACLMAGAMVLQLASAEFELSWEHSVEKTRWRERWRVEGSSLRLVAAGVKGSGAGMDPGEGAVLEGGWWVWRPTLQPLTELVLAASGATSGGWLLCSNGTCAELGTTPGEALHLRVCG